ncbi:alpha/beta-hydrolase [Mycena rosella]|uniref:Alpha/beta-hydrolase n=1 Tax=Mycena rosella TaxID=1033263 RepID=A0AAD7DQU4_MYCRO|nr:alpha/beta-hydrolase [Mycena rosella]
MSFCDDCFKGDLLLADDFSRNGFRTIVPDMFNGDPYPADYGRPGAAPFNREKWMSDHGAAQIRPRIDSVLAALKAEGVTGFAATGYCLGARYVFDLAFDELIRASAISHPGRLQVPADLEKYAGVCTAPLLINSCSDDRAFPLEAQAQADEIFGGGKFAPGYKRAHFEGCTHGFAVRGDISDPMVKAGKEGAFKASVDWFMKYL